MSPASKTTKKLVAGLALMIVAGFGPWLALTLLGWPNAANTAILPAVSLTIACVAGSGWRAGIVVVGPFAVLAGLAAWASPNPWLAAIILAIAAFLRGYAARAGLHDALALTVITLGFLVAMPPQFETAMPAPLVVGLVTLGAGLWATLVTFCLRKWLPKLKRVHLDPIRVLAFSLVLALLVGIATFLVVYFDLGQTGGWIILTVLVIFQPYLGTGFKKAGNRALGTVAGLGITLIVGAFFPTGQILYLLASVFFVLTFLFILQNRPYWLYAMVLTPGVVLSDSATSTVGVVAVERLKGTLVGIGFTLLVMLALTPLAKHLEAKPTPLTR